MKRDKRIKMIGIKNLVIPLITIAVIFFFANMKMREDVRNRYYNLMEVEALNYAKGYSDSLVKSKKAYEIIDGLLNEKLLMVSKMIALNYGVHSNELYKRLAYNLNVDEINLYNSSGEIQYSNRDANIGWKTFKGHPVYNFIHSGSESRVDEIRRDAVSHVYHKYGNFRTLEGDVVQIGILAENIYAFLDGFEMQKILNEIDQRGVADSVSIIDNDLNFKASTYDGFINKSIDLKEIKEIISKDKEYSFVKELNGEKRYIVFMPIFSEQIKTGTLITESSLNAIEATIERVSIFIAGAFFIIFISIIYASYSIYNKNKKLINMAYIDTLTGLPNREYLKIFLSESIIKNKYNKKAILLIKCLNLKTINLTLGFEYGDEFLKEITNKLRELSNSYSVLFRFSAKEFLIYIDKYDNKDDLTLLSTRIIKIFGEPIKSVATNRYGEVQIGIVEIQDTYNDVDQLLKKVSISLSSIDNMSSINYAFFNKEMESQLKREDLIEKELISILRNNHEKTLYLEYQPLVDLRTSEIIGFEALARIKSETLGFISPVEFIDVAEKKQLIVPLGNIILRTACEFISIINKLGYNSLKIAVNISGFQILKEDFTDTVIKIIEDTSIKESNLELEITESVLMNNYKIINERLKSLRKYKIMIALDDFGTGYSSFSRLKELNIDIVKIDKYFIDKIPFTDQQQLITGDIISMSHKLGLMVVAEGVEVEAQKRYLIENDCDIMQGYFFSKPLREKAAIELLKKQKKE